MGFFDRFRTEDVDHYLLRYRAPDDDGWRSPPITDEDFPDPSRMDDPLPKEDVMNAAEVQNWPIGKYQLIGRKANGGFTSSLWTFDIKPDPGEEEDDVDEEMTPEEALLQEFRALRSDLEGGGRVTSPGEAYGVVFEKALQGEEMEPERVQMVREFLREWQSVDQGPPDTPGEFAGRIAQQRFEAGDTDGAADLLQGWFAAERPATGGSLLTSALEGDVELEGSVGLLELAGLDAYQRLEPALDRFADGLGGRAAEAAESGEVNNLLASALAEGSRGQRRDRDGAARADDVDQDGAEADDVDEQRTRRSPDEVASLSEGFGGHGRQADEEAETPAPARASAGPSEPTITPDEADAVAAATWGDA